MRKVLLVLPWDALVSDNRRHVRRGGRAHGWDYVKAKKVLSTIMAAQMKGDPFEVPVSVKYDYYPPNRRRRDCSNYTKVVQDAGNGIVWNDDSLITEWHGLVHAPDGTEPRLELIVQPRRVRRK